MNCVGCRGQVYSVVVECKYCAAWSVDKWNHVQTHIDKLLSSTVAFLRGGGCLKSPPGPQSEVGPKMRNLTIAAMTGQAKSSGPKMVKGPIYIWTRKFGVH